MKYNRNNMLDAERPSTDKWIRAEILSKVQITSVDLNLEIFSQVLRTLSADQDLIAELRRMIPARSNPNMFHQVIESLAHKRVSAQISHTAWPIYEGFPLPVAEAETVRIKWAHTLTVPANLYAKIATEPAFQIFQTAQAVTDLMLATTPSLNDENERKEFEEIHLEAARKSLMLKGFSPADLTPIKPISGLKIGLS